MSTHSTAASLVPVIEIGGTHVTVALVEAAALRGVPATARRRPLDPGGTAGEIVAAVADAATTVAHRVAAGSTWGVAIPGPFDYARGIGRFRDVAKFDALDGVDLGRALSERIGPAAGRMVFLNDAHAFTLGEWAAGAAAGHRRVVGITLGTGIGSAFLADGTVVADGPAVPPEGRVDLLRIDGRPLEETVSRRAILRHFSVAAGSPEGAHDVGEIAELARRGDAPARRVLHEALEALGTALAPWLAGFEATVLVVGGAMSASWDLVEPPLRAGLGASDLVVMRAGRPDEAALVGAAVRVLGPRCARPTDYDSGISALDR